MKIEKELWYTCKICDSKIIDIAKKHGGKNIYYTKVFKKHLEEHNITIEEYLIKKCLLERPICECGCGKQVDVNKKNGSNFKWKNFACGKNKGVLEWSEKAKESRKGSGNPMFNKKPWNDGLTKETNNSIKIMSENRIGYVLSEDSKKKMSESAKKRTIHGHTGMLHSEESKQKMRENTLKMIKNGMYKQTKTKPHVEFCRILKELNVEYEEEKIVSFWCFDIYISSHNLYIEIDGDYFHSNPKIYPNGPTTKTQKINKYRDNKKNEFVLNNSMELYRFWECDILNNPEEIKCKLKELLESKV